jgi:hypothetical protein
MFTYKNLEYFLVAYVKFCNLRVLLWHFHTCSNILWPYSPLLLLFLSLFLSPPFPSSSISLVVPFLPQMRNHPSLVFVGLVYFT